MQLEATVQEAQTLSEAMRALQSRGYVDDFRAQAGQLKALVAKCAFSPSELVVDEVHRFEGETDLDEEMTIFALSHLASAIMGTYVVAFGSKMDPLDAEMVEKLKI
jgi:hypothetical protein